MLATFFLPTLSLPSYFDCKLQYPGTGALYSYCILLEIWINPLEIKHHISNLTACAQIILSTESFPIPYSSKVISPGVFLLTILQNISGFHCLLILPALLPPPPIYIAFPPLFFVFSIFFPLCCSEFWLKTLQNDRQCGVTFFQALSFNHCHSGETACYIFWLWICILM